MSNSQMKATPADCAATEVSPRAEAAVSIIRCSQPIDSILLLRRNKAENDPWSGHFAFPGGRRDHQDETIYATCLRETFEETGVVLNDSYLHDKLAVSLAGSRVKAPIMVQPYIFKFEKRPDVTVEKSEIESCLWLETELFCDRSRHLVAEVLPDLFFPAYPLKDYYLWGFTYVLLCSVLKLDF